VTVRGTVGGVVASAAIVVIAWQVGQSTAAHSSQEAALHVGPTSAPAATTPSTSATAATPSTPSSTAAAPAAPPAPSPSKAASSGNVKGDTIQTPFGNVQVEIVVANGKVSDVKVLQATNFGQRSVQISSYADPILRGEVIQAQSANVQMISGATYTSDGYLQSVQSALDKAGI
jgi:uncharacterized protein with FMN-binding domain